MWAARKENVRNRKRKLRQACGDPARKLGSLPPPVELTCRCPRGAHAEWSQKRRRQKGTPARARQSSIDFGPGRRSATTKNGHGKKRTQTTQQRVPPPSYLLRSHQSRVPVVDSRAPPSHSMHLTFTLLYCKFLTDSRAPSPPRLPYGRAALYNYN